METSARPTGFARFSTVPLGLIVVCFFLPSLRECDVIRSPFDFSIESIGLASWVAPAYLAALLLGLSTALGLARGRAPRPAMGQAAIGLAGLPILGILIWMAVRAVTKGPEPGMWMMAGGLATSLAMAVTIAARSRRAEGWARQRLLVTAYLPLTAIQLFFFVSGLWSQIHSAEHRAEVGPGAYLFLAAVVALGVGGAIAARRPALAAPEGPLSAE
jgi:hypothetical protein